jgi:hypothetical protein
MNANPTLDDFERDLARTLAAKAGQVDVDDAPFHPELPVRLRYSGPHGPGLAGRAGEVGPQGQARTRHGRRVPVRRRLLAAAASAAVLAGGLAVIQALRPDGAVDVATTPAAVTWGSLRAEGTAAFLPADVPDGWALTGVTAGSRGNEAPANWQLFAADGPSPLARGVLVASAAYDDRVIGEPTHTVQGHPAALRATGNSLVPAGALELEWDDGEAFHDVIAVGLEEEELIGFLDSLVPRGDPASGFDAPGGAALPELDSATVAAGTYLPSGAYGLPGGGAVSVYAEDGGFGGGLLHRLAGRPHGDGLLLGGGDADHAFASLARPDGWTVEVVARPALPEPAQLEAILDSTRPVTRQEVIDMVTAAPVTATEAVGDWTVEVHGNDLADVGMCLTPAGGDEVCTTAQSHAGITAGSVLVDGEWALAVITDGPEPATVESAPTGPDPTPEGFTAEQLQGDRHQAGDRTVEVLTVPTGVAAVSAVVPAPGGGGEDGPMTGLGYQRPQG